MCLVLKDVLSVPSENRINVQRGLIKNNNIDFSFYEKKTIYKDASDATKFLSDSGVESSFEIPQFIFVTFENIKVNEQYHDANIFNEMDATNFFVRLEVYPILMVE